MTILYYIIAAVLGAVVALGCYIAVRKIMLKGKKDEILEKARLEAEKIRQEKIFQAKEKFLQLKSAGSGRRRTASTSRIPNSDASRKRRMPSGRTSKTRWKW